MAGPFSAYPISLNGVGYTIVADPTKSDTDAPAGFQGQYAAQESDNQLVYRDVPKNLNDFSGGAGAVRRTGPKDDARYGWAENMFMHYGEGPLPSGQQHIYDLTTITNDNGHGTTSISNAIIIDMIEFLGHLWLITNKSAIIRVANGDPTSTATYDPAINNGILDALGATYGSALSAFGASNLVRCAEVFQTAAGAPALYVGTDNSGIGRVYEITGTGTTITAGTGNFTTGTTYSASKMRSVYWASKSDGTGAQRLLLKTAAGEIRHCIAGSDPKLQASYVTPIKVSLPSNPIQAIVAAPMHAYAICSDGIKDFNETRVSELTPYWKNTAAIISQAASVLGGLPAILYDDHIVASRGYSADRYPVNVDGLQQRIVGEISPGSYFQDGTPIGHGWITAWGEDSGGLLAGVYNPDNNTSYLLRGFDRVKVGIPGPGPILWHGAEQVFPPAGGVTGYMITAIRVVTPSLSASVTLASAKAYLWVALAAVGGGTPIVRYCDLPVGSGPLATRASAGTAIAHASPSAIVVQNCKLYMTGQQYDDDAALKAARRFDLLHQSVSGAATIGVNVRADGDPATLTTDNTFTLEGTANATLPNTATKTNIVPATVTTGQMVYTRLDFTTPAPYTAPPRLQALRLRCNVRYEVFDVRFLNVLLEKGIGLGNGTAEIRATSAANAALVALQLTGPVTFIDHLGVSYQALVEQGISYGDEFIADDNEWRVVARVQVSLVKSN